MHGKSRLFVSKNLDHSPKIDFRFRGLTSFSSTLLHITYHLNILLCGFANLTRVICWLVIVCWLLSIQITNSHHLAIAYYHQLLYLRYVDMLVNGTAVVRRRPHQTRGRSLWIPSLILKPRRSRSLRETGFRRYCTNSMDKFNVLQL